MTSFPIVYVWSESPSKTSDEIDIFWFQDEQHTTLSLGESSKKFLANFCRALLYQRIFGLGGSFPLENEDCIVNVAFQKSGSTKLKVGTARSERFDIIVRDDDVGEFLSDLMIQLYKKNSDNYRNLIRESSFSIFPENEGFMREWIGSR